MAARAFKANAPTVLQAADFAGTFVFAVEGALAAVRAHLDLLGVLVLSFTVALGGGIVRDLLIGAVPPRSIEDWRYPAVAFSGGVAVIALYGLIREVPLPVLVVLDAAGLSLFAVAGAATALSVEVHPVPASLRGT
ncbi:MAG TPA: TRIC cation channel family protein, partial [Thermoanaerobaculia bacterium]